MLDGDDYYIDPTFVSSAIAKLSFCNTQSIVAFFAGFVRLEVEHKKECKIRAVLHVQSSYGFLNLRSIDKITGLVYES